ncbi:sigma-70 family RNA polymerase sigma factor [bacterium]|nr:sigma-70 family RNA polymerase sigma factor [bacterium]MDC0275811.1 sigma-70 family RNA polymerase sigma factor [Verrucomicrobiales bacterium]
MGGENPDPDSEFITLLTAHQSALRLYVASLLPGESRAVDVAQQANTTIWKKRDDFEIGTNFKAWIFAIARFEVLNFRKKQAKDSRRLVFSEELEDMMAEELPQLANDLDIRQTALRDCMENLKTAERELILHRYFHRTPLADYSKEIGRPVGSLKVTLHRIRGKLAKCIGSKMAVKEARA